jgi:hypothetical protein
MMLPQGLLLLIGVYLGVGLLFASAFVLLAVQRLDPAAQRMPLSARLLILPGAVALWPWLGWAWLQRRPPPVT